MQIVKHVRQVIGISQMKFKNVVGRSQGAVSQWELGKSKPDVGSCVKMYNKAQGKVTLKKILESVGGVKIKEFNLTAEEVKKRWP